MLGLICLRNVGRGDEIDGAPFIGVRVGHPDRDAQLVTDHPDRLRQVRVIADDEGAVAVSPKGIQEKVRCQINVRALLLGLDDLDGPWAAGCREGRRHAGDPFLESSEVNGEVGNRPQGAQVGVLALVSARIVRPGGDPRGEVPDSVDAALPYQAVGESVEVQPLVRRSAQATRSRG